MNTTEEPRIGSLCSGYGGLDMAVQDVFGGSVAWFFEYDKAPSKILAHHWPTVPNYGDMTKADWAGIEKVDILCGGTPCQDLSGAGKRAGMTKGTRSNLWVQMREAIAIQRPSIVVWENVRGAYSACADSDMGRCPRCMGEPGEHRPLLRALGRVLGDLSSLGYDSRVIPLRASDVGAAHIRYRLFVVAVSEDVGLERAGRTWERWAGLADGIGSTSETEGLGWGMGSSDDLRCSQTSDTNGGRGEQGERITGSSGKGENRTGLVDERDSRSPHSLAYLTSDEQQRVDDYYVLWESIEDKHPYFVSEDGTDYWPAIQQHEQMIGRPVPPPSIPDGKKGNHRYSPFMGEWMMGLPLGHLTDPAIGLTRNEIHKAAGNGVMTQQAFAAITMGVNALSLGSQ